MERKFPLKPSLPENLFCKYYSYRFKIWLFPIRSFSPVLLRMLCQGVWPTLMTLAMPNDPPWSLDYPIRVFTPRHGGNPVWTLTESISLKSPFLGAQVYSGQLGTCRSEDLTPSDPEPTVHGTAPPLSTPPPRRTVGRHIT